MSETVERSFGSVIKGIKTENGDWKVEAKLFEQRRLDGEELETRELTTTCTDSDYNQALGTAMKATLDKYDDYVSQNGGVNLFSEGKVEIAEVEMEDLPLKNEPAVEKTEE